MSAFIDRSAPGVRITVLPNEKASSGEPLNLEGRILSFSFEDCESKADKVTIQLDNFDLSLFERDELMGGSLLEVSWGYPANMSPPRRVVVQSVKGFQSLTVEGHALSVLMNRVVKTRRWENRTRSDVVREVARDNGYDEANVEIETTEETFEVINQAAETDAAFLTRLAAREGFSFFVDGSGLHWHGRRQDKPPARVFTWFADQLGEVISISVESDLVRRVGGVTVKARDPKDKVNVTASSDAQTAKRTTLGEVLEVINPQTGASTVRAASSVVERNASANTVASSAATSKQAARQAEARFVKAERSSVKLSMQVVGDPHLLAKNVIELRGVPALLAGKYYLAEVKHTIAASGYVCDLKLTRDAKGGRAGTHGKPQTGDKNSSQPKEAGKLLEVEKFEPETGKSFVWRNDGAGSADPEAKGAR